jgi:hypothetical protein
MVSLSQPFLNIEETSPNADALVFVVYNSNTNVKMLPKEDRTLQSFKNVTFENVVLGNVVEDNVEDVFGVDAYISKLHLTNLEK